jgi:hypothetical protein
MNVGKPRLELDWKGSSGEDERFLMPVHDRRVRSSGQ